jgi:hypothetical protein
VNHGVAVGGAVRVSSVGFGLLHGSAHGVEGGCDALLGLGERGTRVSDRHNDELYLPLVILEDRDEVGLYFALFREAFVASGVPAESDLDDDDGAPIPVKGARVCGGCV